MWCSLLNVDWKTLLPRKTLVSTGFPKSSLFSIIHFRMLSGVLLCLSSLVESTHLPCVEVHYPPSGGYASGALNHSNQSQKSLHEPASLRSILFTIHICSLDLHISAPIHPCRSIEEDVRSHFYHRWMWLLCKIPFTQQVHDQRSRPARYINIGWPTCVPPLPERAEVQIYRGKWDEILTSVANCTSGEHTHWHTRSLQLDSFDCLQLTTKPRRLFEAVPIESV